MTARNPATRRGEGDDLVEDRAIEDAADDHFGHAEFAAQAAATIRAIKAPANIAIYAPWGSGKTSLANLLRRNLESDACGFAYFDAFKYAEAPLRREFIRRIAKELDVENDRFGRGLYDEQTTNDFRLESTSLRSLLKSVGIIVGVAILATCLIAVVVAQASQKALWPEWSDTVTRLLPTFLGSAIVLGPLAALVTAQLGVTRKRYAPQSDEEFESLFQELISAARAANKKWERVVMFIDELDRCAADEVASTLETLRTFLEVEPCIFVVAADRSVLETAVGREARQETPFNAQNPYYSLGSSYLDKIFQYQWQLPPMRSSSLTRFAQALVKDRTTGLWAQVNVGEVVSVLVPLHITSPRRVKELLNAYAMIYRIAERRIADGHLDGELPPRSAELAKLVCLRHEFPMFANDLPNEPRLTDLVVALAREPRADRPSDVSVEVWERARAYALGELATDVVIAGSSRVRPTLDDDGDSPEGRAEDRIVEAQGHLLVRYLQKTSRIPGPRSDLIFLESVGSPFGLPEALAVRVQEAATERRVPDVVAAIEPLSVDQQLASLQLLGTHVREALPGVEGANALSTLLGAIGALPSLDLSSIVDELADAANTGIQEDGLPIEDVTGAVQLGLATTRSVGAELIGRALGHDGVFDNESTASFIAERANDFSEDRVARLGEVVAALIVDLPWPGGRDTLLSWSDERGTAVFAATRQPMLDRISAADTTAREQAKEAATEAGTSLDEEEVELTAPNVIEHLSRLADAAKDGNRKRLLEATLDLTLAVDDAKARQVVVDRLPPLGPVASSRLARGLLRAATRRVPEEKPRWLDCLDTEVFKSLSDARAALEAVLVAAVKADATKGDYVGKIRGVAASAERLASSIDWFPAEDLAAAVTANSALPPIESASIQVWRTRLEVGKELEDHRLLNPEEWRPKFIESGIELAGTAQPDEETRTTSRDLLVDRLAWLVDVGDVEVAESFFDALAAAPWLLPPERCLGRVRVLVSDRERGGEHPLELPVEELLEAIDTVSDPASESVLSNAIREWLAGTEPTVEDAVRVLDRFPEYLFPEPVRVGLSSYSEHLTSIERTSLVRLALNRFPEVSPNEVFLEAARFSQSHLEESVTLLTEVYGRATNEDHRRSVMRLWGALRLTDHTYIRKLLEGIFKPLIELNKSGRELALQNLHLVQVLPAPDKRGIAELLEVHADENEWAAARKRLLQAGLMREQSHGLLRSSTIEHLDGR